MIVALNIPNWPQGHVTTVTVHTWYTADDDPQHIRSQRDLPAELLGVFHLVFDPGAQSAPRKETPCANCSASPCS